MKDKLKMLLSQIDRDNDSEIYWLKKIFEVLTLSAEYHKDIRSLLTEIRDILQSK